MSLKRRSAGFMIFTAWSISVLICSPPFIQQYLDQSAIHFTYCMTKDLSEIMPGLELANIIVNFYFPLLIIVVCYSIVFIKIKQKVDRKVAAKMEQLEMMTYSTRMINQVALIILIGKILSTLK